MDRSDYTTRRHVLAAVGAGATVLFGGCSGGGDEPTYENGTINATNGSSRSAEEMVAASALAETEPNEQATSLGSLAIDSHELVVQSGYKGSTVRGTATNSGDRLEYAEVRVRLYDADGVQIGWYFDSTGDLTAGASWQFEVILLASASDIARYDIAIVGIPG